MDDIEAGKVDCVVVYKVDRLSRSLMDFARLMELFERKRILAIAGADSPFVFIWDRDVVGAIVRGVETGAEGVYNLAGDGARGLRVSADDLPDYYHTIQVTTARKVTNAFGPWLTPELARKHCARAWSAYSSVVE